MLGSGHCRKCKKQILEHMGEDCLFDFTQLDAPLVDRVVAALWQGKQPRDGMLTLGIPGGASISYIVKAQSFKWTVSNEPPYYELGRLSAITGKSRGGLVELELIGVGQ